MKKYKISAISIAMVMLLGTLSCARDLDGSLFQLSTINDITITGFTCGDGTTGVSFEVEVGAVLTLEPILEFQLGEASSTYSYGWYTTWGPMGAGLLPSGLTRISEERTLIFTVGADFINIQTRRLMFRITDLNTGVHYDRFVIIQARNRLQRGWWALTERENGFDIDVIGHFQGELVQFNSVLEMTGSALPRTGQRPMSIVALPNIAAPTIFDRDGTSFSVIIQTDVATNVISSRDLSHEPSWNIMGFVQPGHPTLRPGFNPNRVIPMLGFIRGGTFARMYMHYNDNVYLFNTPMIVVPFMLPVNRMRGEANSQFRAAPFIAGGLWNGVLLFDEDNRRFVRHAIGLMVNFNEPSERFLTSLPVPDAPDAIFSFNENIGGLLYMDTYDLDVGFAIIKDTALDRYRLIQFQVTATGATPLRTAVFESNTFVESIERFAMHPSGTRLYMATTDRLYQVYTGLPTLNPTNITENSIQPGYRISTLKFLSTNGGGSFFQEFLTIGSYNPNGVAGANGRLDFFDADTGGGGTGELRFRAWENPDGTIIPKSFTGIGRPVDVAYRYM